MFYRYPLTTRFRIISSGEAGAQIAALDWAIIHGVDHGGWCPKGRLSEAGPISQAYLLSETPLTSRLQPTVWNVRDSDATVIFTLDDALDTGSRRTARFADKLRRPWLHHRPGFHEKIFLRFLLKHRVTTLNIAGPSESAAPGIYRLVYETMGLTLDPS